MPEFFKESPTPALIAVGTLQVLLLIGGCVLLWRFVLRPQARRSRPPSPLGIWNLPVLDFFLAAFAVIAGGVGGQILLGAVGSLLRQREIWLEGDLWIMLNGAAFQGGMLLGAIAAWSLTRPRSSITASTPPTPRPVSAGIVTVMAMMPVLTLINLGWTLLLDATGFPTDQQTAIGLFANADTPAERIVMTLLAVVIAPIGEELIFRAGLFRYLRTRIPRVLALTIPAVVFAALHVEWSTYNGLVAFAPLTALAIFFALAYERTGRIAVTMIAHALFNLNTILLILAGATA